nr:MAG TPA: hypothetical protein [Caudoviricetes sp.]
MSRPLGSIKSNNIREITLSSIIRSVDLSKAAPEL